MIKRKCPNCGKIVESKFCTSCGQDLTGPDIVKICPNCGTETASKFCTGCGAKLVDEPSESGNGRTPAIGTIGRNVTNKKEEALSASELYNKAKKLGAQKVKDLEKSAEAKRAQKEKEAELLREKQEREAEQRRLLEIKEAEERQRQLEEEKRKAQERAELEKKKKEIEQKRVYEEATTYLNTAAEADDNVVSAKFYRKAENLFSSIAGVADADEKSLFAARKAKEQEIIFETEKIKIDQEAKEAEAAAKAEAAEAAKETQQEEIDPKPVNSEKATGKSKGKIIIAIVAAAVLAIAGIVFGLSRNDSNDTTQSEDLDSAQTVTSEQLPTALASDDNLAVTVEKATYVTGASDISFAINAKNNTTDMLKVVLKDVEIDGVTVPAGYDGSDEEIENGDWDISRDIYLSDLSDAGIADFKTLSCSMIVLLDGKALQKTDFSLKREDFSDITVDISGSVVDNSDKTIEISKKNLAPVIASNEQYSIGVDNCKYSKGDGMEINLDVKNNTKELMQIYMEDLKIDDSSISTSRDDEPIQVGEGYAGLYLFADELQAAGVEEFKNVSFTMVVKVGDKEALKQKMHITRDGFL